MHLPFQVFHLILSLQIALLKSHQMLLFHFQILNVCPQHFDFFQLPFDLFQLFEVNLGSFHLLAKNFEYLLQALWTISEHLMTALLQQHLKHFTYLANRLLSSLFFYPIQKLLLVTFHIAIFVTLSSVVRPKFVHNIFCILI